MREYTKAIVVERTPQNETISWDHGLHRTRLSSGSSINLFLDARRIVGWDDAEPREGERWLRCSADAGDTYAMERLGSRLCIGDGLVPDRCQGLSLLRKSAEFGNVAAMVRLAEELLHENPSETDRLEAEQWYRRAIDSGCIFAKSDIGARLITGNGLTAAPQAGLQLLIEAARAGSEIASLRLAACYIDGIGIPADRTAGLEWLRRIGISCAGKLSDAALCLYLKSLSKPPGYAPKLVREAAALFREAVNQGYLPAKLNLAYLIRRGEISGAEFPSLSELLEEGLSAGRPFAKMNQALRLVAGVQCDANWESADRLIDSLGDPEPVLKWWVPRSQESDPEAHFVIAWLEHHEYIADRLPRITVSRFEFLIKAGWPIPPWLTPGRKLHRGSGS